MVGVGARGMVRRCAGQQARRMPLLLPRLPTLLATLSVATALHSNDEFVRNLYRAILCREGDEPGIQEKVASLASGKLTRAQMIMLARFSDEYQHTSAYIPEKLRGRTDGECGACSACQQGGNLNTECCPGPVRVPDGYSASAPDQASFFRYAADDSCSDCIVACPGGWASMAANTGPAKCTDVLDLDCCSPHSPWGTVFLLCSGGLLLLYVGAVRAPE